MYLITPKMKTYNLANTYGVQFYNYCLGIDECTQFKKKARLKQFVSPRGVTNATLRFQPCGSIT